MHQKSGTNTLYLTCLEKDGRVGCRFCFCTVLVLVLVFVVAVGGGGGHGCGGSGGIPNFKPRRPH